MLTQKTFLLLLGTGWGLPPQQRLCQVPGWSALQGEGGELPAGGKEALLGDVTGGKQGPC